MSSNHLTQNSNPSQLGGPEEFLDAAPWAQVESWNPDRLDGAKAGRTEEFRAEDISPGKILYPDESGHFHPPVLPDGRCSIGLAWPTRRTITQLGIEISNAIGATPFDAANVEYWEGNSAWQGKWAPLEGQLSRKSEEIWHYNTQNPGQATQKIRWVFANAKQDIQIKRLVAKTPSPMTTIELIAQMDGKFGLGQGTIQVANGFIISDGKKLSNVDWSLGTEAKFTIHCTKPTLDTYTKSDQTLLLLHLPEEEFAVAVNDVLERGPVHVPRAGFFISTAPVAESLEARKRKDATKKTILAQVRSMPDQTREQAMATAHYPRLDVGPVMLSLACDNNKFKVDRNGSITYLENFSANVYPEGGGFPQETTPPYTVQVQYGYPRVVSITNGWGIISLGVDAAASPDARSAPPIQIKDQTYQKGIGLQATSEIIVDLNKEYERFECEVGTQLPESNRDGAGLVFKVVADGGEVYDSGIMRPEDPPNKVCVSVAGVRHLALRSFDAGNTSTRNLANWAEARFMRKEMAEPEYLSDWYRHSSVIQRKLDGGWLPAPVSVKELDGIRYTQRTYVIPFGESSTPFNMGGRSLAIAEITVENLKPEIAKAAVRLQFHPIGLRSSGIAMSADSRVRCTRVQSGNRIIARMDSERAKNGTIQINGANWSWASDLQAGSCEKFCMYLPSWKMGIADSDKLPSQEDLFPALEQYWNKVMDGAMQVRTPDEWLNNAIRANQVHVYMAARNEDNGTRIAPWISSCYYDHAFDSEGNSVVRGMVKTGHFEFARRAFDFYFSRYRPEGFMTTGYTLHGSGWHLRTLAEYMRFSKDTDWLHARAHFPIKMCNWITAQREKTKATLPNGERKPEWGLMPPGTVADWPVFAHYFYGEGQYASGVRDIGAVLREIGCNEAENITSSAAEYLRELLRAFRYAQANAPVVPLRNGAWVPFHPLAVHVPGPAGDFYRSSMDQMLHGWRYDVELGASHLGVFGIIDPNDVAITDMLEYMEDYQFLCASHDAYPADRNQEDWFNLGGFGKLQPYYGEIPELYAARDEVKPFLRSYFNTLASLISNEVLSIYEGFEPFCINKTHETGYFLGQSRDMMVMERGEELWLAPLVTDYWLKDGMEIEVKDAPSEFGRISYRIRSAIASGFIEAQVDPPSRSAPKTIVLRLRHPEGKPIRSAKVSNGDIPQIDPAKDTIRFQSINNPIHLMVLYE